VSSAAARSGRYFRGEIGRAGVKSPFALDYRGQKWIEGKIEGRK